MRNDYPQFIISITFALVLTWIFSCSGRPGNVEKENSAKSTDIAGAPEPGISVKILSPEENAGFKLNETVKITLDAENESADSIVLTYDSHRIAVLKSEPWEYTIPRDYINKTGKKSIKATTYKNGRKPGSTARFIIILSDKAPDKYGYKVLHTYPHDTQAFTQGLFYYNGILYEGTGQQTSNLREVELETGRVIRQHNLDASLFGEGITLYKDRIFQVTWENKVGFVYDMKSFEVVNRISYPMQGWGLTTIGDRIVMSDGTNVIYFFEPDMFTVLDRIEVYDDKEQVDSLNELEYINGEIWANVWMKDIIVRIDPKTGKVNSIVDLSGLLKAADKTPETDVLNGIAWDKEKGRLFVTGKLWPKLFEISVTR